jgi:hypothetical protein
MPLYYTPRAAFAAQRQLINCFPFVLAIIDLFQEGIKNLRQQFVKTHNTPGGMDNNERLCKEQANSYRGSSGPRPCYRFGSQMKFL